MRNGRKDCCVHRGFPLLLCLLALLLCLGSTTALAEEETVYTDIAYGTVSEEVLAFQTRLKELGYFSESVVLNPSVFDGGTQEAVRLFCETNHISYDGTGVSAAIQHIAFSEGAIAYEAPEVKRSISEKLTDYMTRRVSFLGSRVPLFFLWICGVVIVVLILALLVYFFVPGREKAESVRGTAPETMPRYWRKTVTGSSGLGVSEAEKLSGAGRILDFRVQYEGSDNNFERTCDPVLSIGRSGSCQLVLDPRDILASNRHCELYYRGEVLMLRDSSSNGTTVNGRLIHKSECRLNSGDRLGIGAHSLLIQF